MFVLFQVRISLLLMMTLFPILAITSGCGGSDSPQTGQVSGTVTFNSNPLSKGIVTFEDAALGRGGSAMLKEGRFEFDTPLNTGNYKVTVQPPPPPAPTAAHATSPSPAIIIPKKYQQPATSDLTAVVKEGTNQFEFKLMK